MDTQERLKILETLREELVNNSDPTRFYWDGGPWGALNKLDKTSVAAMFRELHEIGAWPQRAIDLNMLDAEIARVRHRQQEDDAPAPSIRTDTKIGLLDCLKKRLAEYPGLAWDYASESSLLSFFVDVINQPGLGYHRLMPFYHELRDRGVTHIDQDLREIVDLAKLAEFTQELQTRVRQAEKVIEFGARWDSRAAHEYVEADVAVTKALQNESGSGAQYRTALEKLIRLEKRNNQPWAGWYRIRYRVGESFGQWLQQHPETYAATGGGEVLFLVNRLEALLKTMATEPEEPTEPPAPRIIGDRQKECQRLREIFNDIVRGSRYFGPHPAEVWDSIALISLAEHRNMGQEGRRRFEQQLGRVSRTASRGMCTPFITFFQARAIRARTEDTYHDDRTVKAYTEQINRLLALAGAPPLDTGELAETPDFVPDGYGLEGLFAKTSAHEVKKVRG